MKNERRLIANNWRRLLLALLLVSSVLIVSAPREGKSAATTTAQPKKGVVVFAVSAESGEGSMDAVVIVDGKLLRAPYTDEQKDRQKKFADEYFAAGRTYRLIFGGGGAGSVTVKKWSEGCNNVHAEITPATSVRLGGKVMALATNSETLGKRASARRAPTDAERAQVMALMKSIYSQNRTLASLIPSIKATNLTATDLDGDGKYEMIGSFTLAAKNEFERDLFLIAHQQGASMRADFVKFQAYKPPPEGFLSSIDFIDQLDLDGDGVGEVFATQGGFDGYALLIFKKVGGRWRQVYDTIGDAC
ncbi:MAG TPA: hypothetical protein VHD88_00875 [Pyrinomonadaceae bacterium]|nr:hypothetical protein [Pyrinomonadaceae bacterium]